MRTNLNKTHMPVSYSYLCKPRILVLYYLIAAAIFPQSKAKKGKIGSCGGGTLGIYQTGHSSSKGGSRLQQRANLL